MRTQRYLMLASFLAIGAIAHADTLRLNNVSNNAPTDTAGNYISPYSGTLVQVDPITHVSTSLDLSFFCDDFTHNIVFGTTYSNVTEATLISSNFLTSTLFGQQLGAGAKALYQQVFYLSDLESKAITAGKFTTAGTIQDAIWNLTYQYEPNKNSGNKPPTVTGFGPTWGTAQYLQDAADNYAKYDYSNFVIVDAAPGRVQEQFYSTGSLNKTPEPGTVAMLIGSIAVLGYYRRRSTRS